MYENFPFLFFFVVTAVVLETMISGKLLGGGWVGNMECLNLSSTVQTISHTWLQVVTLHDEYKTSTPKSTFTSCDMNRLFSYTFI